MDLGVCQYEHILDVMQGTFIQTYGQFRAVNPPAGTCLNYIESYSIITHNTSFLLHVECYIIVVYPYSLPALQSTEF